VTVATSVSASPEGRPIARTFVAQDAIALAGRALISAIFVMSGLGKVTQPAATIAYMTAVGLPLAPLGLAAAALVELGGGIALIFGYRTRFVAAALAVFAIVTALIFHSALSDQSQFIHFFKNVAVAGGLLQVVAFGGGRFSVDAQLGGRIR
jgi:putative oxidoreductase